MDAPTDHPSAGRQQTGLAEALPKIWIGYLLCLAAFVDEVIVAGNHPEIVDGQVFVPPLHLFLLVFVSGVYWLVCVHKLHVVLAHVPDWQHPISPARAVWFHFIPIYHLYWLFKWPSETACFVNSKLQTAVLKPRGAGFFVLSSYIFAIFLGPILLFFSLSYLNNWVRRALLTPSHMPASDQ